jgi:hypothetical protein
MQINSPYAVFIDTTGLPAQNGALYVGQAGLNPTNPTYQLSLYADSAFTVPVAQPVKLLNGQPVQGGTPITLFAADQTFSLMMVNSAGIPVFSNLNVTPPFTSSALQLQTGTAFTAGGVAPAFTLTPTPSITAYSPFMRFNVQFPVAGSTLVTNTLNVSGIGTRNLMQYNSTGSVIPAIIAAGMITDVEFDGTQFIILDPLVGTSSSSAGPTSLLGISSVYRAQKTGGSVTVSAAPSGNIITTYDAAGFSTINNVPATSLSYSAAPGQLVATRNIKSALVNASVSMTAPVGRQINLAVATGTAASGAAAANFYVSEVADSKISNGNSVTFNLHVCGVLININNPSSQILANDAIQLYLSADSGTTVTISRCFMNVIPLDGA